MSHNEHHSLKNVELPHSPSKGVVTEQSSSQNTSFTNSTSSKNTSESNKNTTKESRSFL